MTDAPARPQSATVAVFWVGSVIAFFALTYASLGSTPIAFVAWSLAAWPMLTRTVRWWPLGDELTTKSGFQWLRAGWIALLLGVGVIFTIFASGFLSGSSIGVVVDRILVGLYLVCLGFPVVAAAWAILHTMSASSRSAE